MQVVLLRFKTRFSKREKIRFFRRLHALRLLIYLERRGLSILFRLLIGKKKRDELIEKGFLPLEAITHHFPSTHLLDLLISTHYLTFSDGFHLIESCQHAKFPSVIREMRDCYLTANRGDVVIDVGANYGFYSLLSSHLVGKEGFVLAFEPETTNYNIFLANLRLNGITNVKAFKMGLGAVDGETRLYLSEHPGAHSTTIRRSSRFETVNVKRLDVVLEEIDIEKVNLIKLDAEGAELDILCGALETIRKHKPRLTIASYHYANEVENIEKFLKEYLSFYDIVKKIHSGEGVIIHAISRSYTTRHSQSTLHLMADHLF